LTRGLLLVDDEASALLGGIQARRAIALFREGRCLPCLGKGRGK
jgi:hypothetical protein